LPSFKNLDGSGGNKIRGERKGGKLKKNAPVGGTSPKNHQGEGTGSVSAQREVASQRNLGSGSSTEFGKGARKGKDLKRARSDGKNTTRTRMGRTKYPGERKRPGTVGPVSKSRHNTELEQPWERRGRGQKEKAPDGTRRVRGKEASKSERRDGVTLLENLAREKSPTKRTILKRVHRRGASVKVTPVVERGNVPTKKRGRTYRKWHGEERQRRE